MAEATNVEHDVGSIDDAIINQMEQIQREISESQDLVGELEDMASLVSEYQTDPVYSLKAKDLAKGYVKLRRTRGDGNCFFRAFAFACVEKLNKKELDTKKFKEKLEKAKETVLDLGYPSFTVEDFHDTFMDVIDSLKDSSSDEDLLKVFQDQGQSDYLVCYLRIVTSGYLQKNSEFYLPFLQGHATIKDFCSKEVEPMRCESDHVHISALTQALDVNVRVQYMDRGEGGKVNHHDFPEGSEPCLHLLYRPGHYDILYLAPARCSENNQMRAVLPSEVTAEIQLVSCKCANIIDLKQTSSIVKDLPPFPLQHVKRVRKHEEVSISLERKLYGQAFNQDQLANISFFMQMATEEARLGSERGEHPVGVVICDPISNSVVARAHPLQATHPLKHAVMVCIDRVAASQGGGAWEKATPTESETSEPNPKRSKVPKQYLCTGCSMALLHSRIQRVFYGVPDPLAGGLGSKFLIHCQKGLNHHFEVYSHVEYAKCQNVTSSEKNAV